MKMLIPILLCAVCSFVFGVNEKSVESNKAQILESETRLTQDELEITLWLNSLEPPKIVFSDSGTTWKYLKIEIEGWNVYIGEKLKLNSRFMAAILSHVQIGLKHINQNVPKTRAAQLKQFPIWIDDQPNYPDFWPGENGQIPFHINADWLRENNLNPAMAWGVHIINPYNVLYSSKHFEWQPHVLLHELTHGLNLKIMTDAERYMVTYAYQNAKKNKLYLNVERKWRNTGESKIQASAYAISNEGDYIAELTEAYFGYNETFPFNREQLSQYDPVGYRMVKRSWLDNK